MVVLGIDPGLARTGFGVVRVEGQRVSALAHGDIPTRPRLDPAERLHRIHAGIAEVLARHEPGYERDPTKKIQLLTHLAGLKHARVSPLVAPYLEDMDEGVRYAAVEALLKQGEESVARLPLIEHIVKEDSLRLRIRIADGFAELGWAVADRRAEVEKVLPDTYQIEARGADVRIKKKPGAKE